MKVSGFNEAVTIAVTQEGKYHPEGYQFLRESLEATLKKRAKSKQKPQTTMFRQRNFWTVSGAGLGGEHCRCPRRRLDPMSSYPNMSR